MQRFLGAAVTYWFLHSFKWLVPISVGRSRQNGCRTVDRSPLGWFATCIWKSRHGLHTCRTRRSYRIKWKALADKDVRKTFADSVSSLFRELLECTADAEVEWRLFKAATASPAVRVCGRKRLGVENNGKKSNLFMEPGGERCYSSKESSLQGLRLQNKADCSLQSPFAEAPKSATLMVKKPAMSCCGINQLSKWYLNQQWEGHPWQVKRVFQDLLEPGQHYTTEHTRGTFGEENTITAAEVFLAVKTLKAAGCDEIRPEMLETLNRDSSVAGVCVSGGLVFWKGTRRLVNWGDHPQTQKWRQEWMQQPPEQFLVVTGKVNAKCLEKRCRKIIKPNLDHAQRGFRPGRSTTIQTFTAANFREFLE